MKICYVKVRVESEDAYWREQVQRVQAVEQAGRAGKAVRIQGTELVFTSLKDMARTLTPKRLDLLRLIRRERPTSVRGLARLAGRDLKNVLATARQIGYDPELTQKVQEAIVQLCETGKEDLDHSAMVQYFKENA